ncbi:MAG: hypothetical protein ACD_56C00112G0007 [uncultured bacterium]|nr:MAG: hypothetical protein ACD_56C00112G0007 [uncultured bacterium]
MKKLVLGLALLVYMLIAVMSATESHAHCGKKHEREGRIYMVVALPTDEQLATDLNVTAQQVEESEGSIEDVDLEKSLKDNDSIDDQVVVDMYNGYSGAGYKLSNGRFNSIAPANIVLESK